jgi:phosphoglycolate phosphatase-like HAD superfamily hydrolase
MKIRAYLFDFDGTLIDSMGGFADIAGRIISEYHPGISFDTARKMYLDTSGVPFFQQVEIMFPGDKTNPEKVKIFEETKKSGFFSKSFSADVRYTINTMRERGLIAGVSSNNYQHLIDQFVEREGLEFDVIMGFSEGFEKGKDHFDFVLKKFSLKRKELTFVGDSLKDADKAAGNKIRFIGLEGTFTGPDFHKKGKDIIVIKNIKELLDL